MFFHSTYVIGVYTVHFIASNPKPTVRIGCVLHVGALSYFKFGIAVVKLTMSGRASRAALMVTTSKRNTHARAIAIGQKIPVPCRIIAADC
jgi:hypothetical protein